MIINTAIMPLADFTAVWRGYTTIFISPPLLAPALFSHNYHSGCELPGG